MIELRVWELKVFGIIWICFTALLLSIAVVYYRLWNRKPKKTASLGVALISAQLLKNFQFVDETVQPDITNITKSMDIEAQLTCRPYYQKPPFTWS